MNRFLWTALIGVSALAGCHKHNTPTSSSLIGQWRTTIIYDGGFTGATHKVYPDSVFILTFNKDSTYEERRNGRLHDSGRFMAISYKPSSSAADSIGILFTSRVYVPYSVHLEKDQLKLTAYDIEAAPSSTYIRVK